LPHLKGGHSLDATVPAGQTVVLKIAIDSFPELPPNHQGNRLSLSGELEFKFAGTEIERIALDSESAIVVNQMFSSGFDIDEFF
jgi:hypothetical protein